MSSIYLTTKPKTNKFTWERKLRSRFQSNTKTVLQILNLLFLLLELFKCFYKSCLHMPSQLTQLALETGFSGQWFRVSNTSFQESPIKSLISSEPHVTNFFFLFFIFQIFVTIMMKIQYSNCKQCWTHFSLRWDMTQLISFVWIIWVFQSVIFFYFHCLLKISPWDYN